MKYLLMLYYADAATEAANMALPVEEHSADIERHVAFAEWMKQNGIRELVGEPLLSSTDATTVRPGADGKLLVTDGPVADKEIVGSFYLLECDDHELAVEAAQRCPNYGAVELRPVAEIPS